MLISPCVRALASVAAVLALGLWPTWPAGAAPELQLGVEVGAGADSNPERLVEPGSPTSLFGLALVRGKLSARGDQAWLDAALTAAGRLYPDLADADAVATRLELALGRQLAGGFSASLTLAGSDLTERRHAVDQDSARGLASLGWARGPWRLELGAGYGLFAPRDEPLTAFLAHGPEGAARARFGAAPGHAITTVYGLVHAAYPRWDELAAGGRSDTTHTLSVEYAHDGAFLAAVGYAFAWNLSSAVGGDYTRHRLTARAAFELGPLTVAARGVLQYSSYPDPLYVGQQLLLAQDQDLVEVRATYPLGESFELALAAAHHRGEATGGVGPDYARTVTSLSLGWRSGRGHEP